MENQVVIIAGDTGCGKSTQVPQYLMQAGFNKIACTQPRRIAAISLAKRVALEAMKQNGSEVAYQIRFEGTKSKNTRILFLTEGLLLRQFQQDSSLSQYDVIILDEIHERHLQSDFLLGLLKRLVENPPNNQSEGSKLRIILMSATINLELFSSYFRGSPCIQVPGRLFPIELQYRPIPMEDKSTKTSRINPAPYLRILRLIDKKYDSSERGDLLVFLPGMQEITTVEDAMRSYAEETKRWIVLPLHSTLGSEEQQKVFNYPPPGVRKCVLSTNIAETSVTVDGVRFVVDSGKHKQLNYDANNKMNKLQEMWISRASAEQRKGRAGRTGPGTCFRLYNQDDYDVMVDYSPPEIRRVPLESLVLQMKSMGIDDVRNFPFIETPSDQSMNEAIDCLVNHQALDGSSEKITPVGGMLAQLPVDVAVGKMLLMGSLFDVTDEVMTVAACLSVQSVFTRKAHNDIECASRRKSIESDHGDPITLLHLFDEWIQIKGQGRTSSSKWCRRRGLEEQRFYEITNIKKQFQDLLKDNSLLRKVEVEKKMTSQQRKQRHLDKRKLKRLNQEHKDGQRGRKILKMRDGGGDTSSDDDVTTTNNEKKDLQFRLRHDLDEMYSKSSERRNLTYRDLLMLKLVLTSGIYPQYAILDECNSYVNGTDQILHTRNKKFTTLHPNSYFANHCEVIQPSDYDITEGRRKEKSASHKHQLITYTSLLETKKPYLCNTMRVPALQTLLLFSRSIDTNNDCTRLIADDWIELTIEDADQAERLIVSTITLRNAWAKLLCLRIKIHQESVANGQQSDQANEEQGFEVVKLQKFLTEKISEFLDSKINYQIRRLKGKEKEDLYVGPDFYEEKDLINSNSSKLLSDGEIAKPHPTKGGIMTSQFMTFNCVKGGESSKYSEHLRSFWTCPVCQEKILVTLSEKIRHQVTCSRDEPIKKQESEEESSPTSGSIFCEICKKHLVMTPMQFLLHKRNCKSRT